MYNFNFVLEQVRVCILWLLHGAVLLESVHALWYITNTNNFLGLGLLYFIVNAWTFQVFISETNTVTKEIKKKI